MSDRTKDLLAALAILSLLAGLYVFVRCGGEIGTGCR